MLLGKNLALNVRNHGFSVSGFSIDKPEVDAFAKYEDDKLKPCYTWEEFVNSLEKPRKILIQIMAWIYKIALLLVIILMMRKC